MRIVNSGRPSRVCLARYDKRHHPASRQRYPLPPTVSLVVAAHNRLNIREIVEVLLKQGRRIQTWITSRGTRFTRRQRLDGGELSFEVATGVVRLP